MCSTTPAAASPTPHHISPGDPSGRAVERALDADDGDRQRQQQTARPHEEAMAVASAPAAIPADADRGQADRDERPAGEHHGEDDQGDHDLGGAGAERGQTERHGDHRRDGGRVCRPGGAGPPPRHRRRRGERQQAEPERRVDARPLSVADDGQRHVAADDRGGRRAARGAQPDAGRRRGARRRRGLRRARPAGRPAQEDAASSAPAPATTAVATSGGRGVAGQAPFDRRAPST